MQSKKLTTLIVGINSLLMCGLADAQQAPPRNSLEEVVVTARNAKKPCSRCRWQFPR